MTKLGLITAFLVTTMASANANVIDTTTGGASGAYIAFGPGATPTYGQTFFAAGNVLDSFSLYLETKTAGSGPLELRGYPTRHNFLPSW